MTRLLPATMAIVVVVLTVAFAAQTISAQSGRVRIAGRVMDPSGAVLPGVTMNLAGGDSPQMAITDPDGRYEFSAMTPGEYRVSATLSGYRASSRTVSVTTSGSFALDFVLHAGCAIEYRAVDDGLAATLTASDAVLHVRIGDGGSQGSPAEGECDQWYEHRATVLNAIKSPKLTSDVIQLLLHDPPRYRSGDELIVFARRDSSGRFVEFRPYTFPVNAGLVAWTRSELPGITSPAPIRQVLEGLRGVLFMVR